MRMFYTRLRARMLVAGLWPQGWIVRGACYSLGLAVGLFVLQMVLNLFAPSWAGSIGGWVKFLVFDAALLFSIVAFRWLKRKLLWRLRNRLIVTYVFIGVIPAFLLVAMAAITIYLFAGQFASFVVTSEINSQLRSLQAVNAAVSNELAARIEKGQAPTAESLAGLRKRDRAWGRRRVCAWYGTRVLLLSTGNTDPALMTFPDFFNKDGGEYAKAIREGQPFKQIVRDNDELYLRVASVFAVGPENLTVITGEPLDKNLVSNIAANLGEITLYSAGIMLDSQGKYQNPTAPNASSAKQPGFQTRLFNETGKSKGGANEAAGKPGSSPEGDQQIFRPTFTVGSLAAPAGMMDREIAFGTPLPVVDWKTGDLARAGALVKVRTRPSVLYTHLFAALGDIARGVEYILLAILI